MFTTSQIAEVAEPTSSQAPDSAELVWPAFAIQVRYEGRLGKPSGLQAWLLGVLRNHTTVGQSSCDLSVSINNVDQPELAALGCDPAVEPHREAV